MGNRRTVRIAIRYALAVLLVGFGIYAPVWGAKESCSCQAVPVLLGAGVALVLCPIGIIVGLRANMVEYWTCPICKTRNEETRSECVHCGERRRK